MGILIVECQLCGCDAVCHLLILVCYETYPCTQRSQQQENNSHMWVGHSLFFLENGNSFIHCVHGIVFEDHCCEHLALLIVSNISYFLHFFWEVMLCKLGTTGDIWCNFCFVMKSYPRMTRTMRLKCDFSISNLTGVAWISLNAFAVSFHSFAVHHISNHLSHSLTSTLVNVLGRLMCWQRIRTSSWTTVPLLPMWPTFFVTLLTNAPWPLLESHYTIVTINIKHES